MVPCPRLGLMIERCDDATFPPIQFERAVDEEAASLKPCESSLLRNQLSDKNISLADCWAALVWSNPI